MLSQAFGAQTQNSFRIEEAIVWIGHHNIGIFIELVVSLTDPVYCKWLRTYSTG